MSRLDSQSFLIVDATPVDAQVFVDGRLLGSAGHLVARAVPLTSGRHVLAVIAPGFKPYATQFATDPSFPTRIRIALAPE